MHVCECAFLSQLDRNSRAEMALVLAEVGRVIALRKAIHCALTVRVAHSHAALEHIGRIANFFHHLLVAALLQVVRAALANVVGAAGLFLFFALLHHLLALGHFRARTVARAKGLEFLLSSI